jgi:L-ribulose-5-phosphate 4-epimerase
MAEHVIKYNLKQRNKGFVFRGQDYRRLNKLRDLFYAKRLIGQNDALYDGLCYGNISIRYRNTDKFIISCSQSGHIRKLNRMHYTLVDKINIRKNHIVACGLHSPSSESLSHGAIYQGNKNIKYVVHIHSANIWQNYKKLNLFGVDSSASYGSTYMACACKDYVKKYDSLNYGAFVLLGHQDGIMLYAKKYSTIIKKLNSIFKKQ